LLTQLYLRILEDLPKPQAEQTLWRAWKETLPQRLQVMCVVFCRFPIEGVPLLIESYS